jgi:uncharacterized protein (DUF927 family)
VDKVSDTPSLDEARKALEHPTPAPHSPELAERAKSRQRRLAKEAEQNIDNSLDVKAARIAKQYKMRSDGLFKLPSKPDEKPMLICDPFEVVGITRDTDQNSAGRLLRWKDADSHVHEWAMPMSLLAGDGQPLRTILLDGGLYISSAQGARQALNDYLGNVCPTARFRCVDRIGWHEMQGTSVYVLPDVIFGTPPGDENIILQNARTGAHHFTVSGTLDGWRKAIALPSVGNSRKRTRSWRTHQRRHKLSRRIADRQEHHAESCRFCVGRRRDQWHYSELAGYIQWA